LIFGRLRPVVLDRTKRSVSWLAPQQLREIMPGLRLSGPQGQELPQRRYRFRRVAPFSFALPMS
jgi:hypothetical protein